MAYSHENLALALGLEYDNAQGIETKDGQLTAFPEKDLGPRPTDEQLSRIVNKHLSTLRYKEARVRAYPSIEDQLDIIYHKGVDAWKSEIKAIKDKYPKPTQE